jgi:hypothetical protein
LKEDHGDLAVAQKFIEMSLEKSPDLQVYIFARWPRKDKHRDLDYGQQWLREYTGEWDNTNETKDYFERLVLELRRSLPQLKKPVLLVPVGHVMHELDRRMHANEVPGLSRIHKVYRDRIHLDRIGSYVVACTFYATLYGDNPVNLPTDMYGEIDPQLARVIQETVWKVVATHTLSGVVARQPPEYTSPAPSRTRPAPRANTSRSPSKAKPRPLSRDQQYRQLVVGTWEDDYQGKRTMTLAKDGTGTMIVELSGVKATLFAARLEFDMVWSIENGRLKKRTIGGKPQRRVNMILKMMGDRVDEPILELTQQRLLLLDKDGKTRYDWRRKK